MLEVYMMGRRLAGKRTEKRLTQKEVGLRAGVSPTLVAQVELGRRKGVTLDAFVKICETLDVSVEWAIYGDSGQPRQGAESAEERGGSV